VPAPSRLRNAKYRFLNPARYVLQQARAFGTPGRRGARILLASDLLEYTSEAQYSPFAHYRERLFRELAVSSLHTDVATAKVLLGLPGVHFDIVGLKLSFRTDNADVESTVRGIHGKLAGAKFVYFDGDDDVNVQWPEILGFVDLYVKKHVYKDRAQYGVATIGKSNLTQYAHDQYGATFATDIIPRGKPVSVADRGKIHAGYNIALDDKIRKLHEWVKPPTQAERPFDVVCRANINPQSWMYHLRKGIAPALQAIKGEYRILTPTERVPQDVYYQEMLSSKICVSPFGYGEICWRDFEAVLCGCVLFKPDMGHIETHPDIFIPYETYVPLAWDFSDLTAKSVHYLRDTHERSRIASNARRVLVEYYRDNGFVRSVVALFERLAMEVRPQANHGRMQ